MKTKIIIILVVLCVSVQAAPTPTPTFDALGIDPEIIGSQNATVQGINKNFRQTYSRLIGLYVANARALEAPGARAALTPAQQTEADTLQWLIYNILKSINPSLSLPVPGTTPAPLGVGATPTQTITPKPTATPKKK